MVKNENNDIIINDNIFNYIRSLYDVDDFVEAIKVMCSSYEYVQKISAVSLQLLWLLAAYLFVSAREDEHNVQSMLALLNKACMPTTSRNQKSTFTYMVEESTDAHLKENYEYFLTRVFGTYSNYYRTTIEECRLVLKRVLAENNALISAFKAIPNDISDKKTENAKHLFGKLSKKTGQDLQIQLYENRKIAIHEAGHAVANCLLKIPFAGVNIIAADEGQGCVQPIGWDKVSAQNKAISLYAGLVAEEILFAPAFLDVWGASDDILRATKIVKKEIQEKYRAPGNAQKYIFIDAEALGLGDNESPFIVYETIKLCEKYRAKTFQLINDNEDLVKAVARELLDVKTLSAEECVALVDKIAQKRQPNNSR